MLQKELQELKQLQELKKQRFLTDQERNRLDELNRLKELEEEEDKKYCPFEVGLKRVECNGTVWFEQRTNKDKHEYVLTELRNELDEVKKRIQEKEFEESSIAEYIKKKCGDWREEVRKRAGYLDKYPDEQKKFADLSLAELRQKEKELEERVRYRKLLLEEEKAKPNEAVERAMKRWKPDLPEWEREIRKKAGYLDY